MNSLSEHERRIGSVAIPEEANITAFDGPPGTGKTRRIVHHAAKDYGHMAVVTYTKDAAAIVRQRAPDVVSGTIYSLTWDYVKPFVDGRTSSIRNARSYTQRKIHHILDPALEQYRLDAPSLRAPNRLDELAVKLHSWRDGKPPFNLNSETATAQLKFALPMARWLEAGAPMPRSRRYDFIMIDESQDISWLELRATAALVNPGGEIWAFGDPGQAIFGASKGMVGNALPPVWQCANSHTVIDKGYRVGDPVASVAANVLRSWYDRPASTFMAEHVTTIIPWDAQHPPRAGLVLGYSRNTVHKTFIKWGLTGIGIVPKVAAADREMVLSTGHAAKGAEADDVYLLPWSRQAMNKLEGKDPATLRLLYVMLTRARKRLHVPTTLKARLVL